LNEKNKDASAEEIKINKDKFASFYQGYDDLA